MSDLLSRVAARVILSTLIVDRLFDRLDRLRSRVVGRLASDAVLEAFNDLTYGQQKVYEAGSAAFRADLFNWEANLLDRVMPPPPGRILVGGAGGGREAFALAERGYEVTAFEPSPALARSMADQAAARSARVEPLIGRYEQLPRLRSMRDASVVDLEERPRFDGAILGWTSYSHLRSRAARVSTLRAFARVTDGPVALSFYFERQAPRPAGRAARVLDAIGLSGGLDRFTPHVGFFHLSRREELEAEIADAGLRLLDASWDDSDGRWPWVAVAAAR
jgi:SAM-dependent methyltransferase